MKDTLLSQNKFEEALSTYLHELCHSFGGDSSQRFSAALTDLLATLLKNHEKVAVYKNLWNNINIS